MSRWGDVITYITYNYITARPVMGAKYHMDTMWDAVSYPQGPDMMATEEEDQPQAPGGPGAEPEATRSEGGSAYS